MNIRPGQKLVAEKGIMGLNVFEPIKRQDSSICVVMTLFAGDTIDIIEPCGKPKRDMRQHLSKQSPQAYHGDKFTSVVVTLQASSQTPSRTYIGKVYDSWLQYQVQQGTLSFV